MLPAAPDVYAWSLIAAGSGLLLQVLLHWEPLNVRCTHGQTFSFVAALLQVLCHWTMARRIVEVVAAAASDGAMLSRALRTVLQRAPAELAWQHLTADSQYPLASFQAVGSDGHLYSINCLDGTVLQDGSPPGRWVGAGLGLEAICQGTRGPGHLPLPSAVAAALANRCTAFVASGCVAVAVRSRRWLKQAAAA